MSHYQSLDDEKELCRVERGAFTGGNWKRAGKWGAEVFESPSSKHPKIKAEKSKKGGQKHIREHAVGKKQTTTKIKM